MDKTAAPQFKRTAAVTVGLLTFKERDKIFVRFEEPVHKGKAMTKDGITGKPSDVVRVTNLETGEIMDLLCPRVLASILEEKFGKQEYVGECFEIMAKDIGKAYKAIEMYQIEAP